MIHNGTDELYYCKKLLDAVRIIYSYKDNAVIQALGDDKIYAATDVSTGLGELNYLCAVRTDEINEAKSLISSDLTVATPQKEKQETRTVKSPLPLLIQQPKRRI